MPPWLYVFLASLALVMFIDTHLNTRNVIEYASANGCQGLPTLRETLRNSLRLALIEESMFRLAPLALVRYGVLSGVSTLDTLLLINAGSILGFAYLTRNLRETVTLAIGTTLMISLWMLLMPLLGLWLTYASAVALRLSLVSVVYFMVMNNVRTLCVGGERLKHIN